MTGSAAGRSGCRPLRRCGVCGLQLSCSLRLLRMLRPLRLDVTMDIAFEFGRQAVPTDADGVSSAANAAAHRVHNILLKYPGEAVVPLVDLADDELTVPREAAEMLERLLSSLAQGQPMMLLPDHAELTTQQAADLLGVSRPHLIKLLDTEAIEYRLVGKHRRIDAKSLRTYREVSRAQQRAAADALSELTEEMGLY